MKRTMSLLILVMLCFSTGSIHAQKLVKHGEVRRIVNGMADVAILTPWQVIVGTDGVIFLETEETAAEIQVSRIEGSVVKCRIIGESEKNPPKLGMGVWFNKVSQIRPGILEINSTPQRAVVTINGKDAGEMPTTKELNPGTYRVRAEMTGYVSNEQIVRLAPGEQKTVELILEKQKLIEEEKPVSFYLEKGNILFQNRQYDKSRLYFERSLELMPGDIYCQDKLKEIQKIMEEQRAQEIQRKWQEEETRRQEREQRENLEKSAAWRIAASNYMGAHDYSKAEMYINQILNVLPADSQVVRWKSVVFRNKIRSCMAEKNYNAARPYLAWLRDHAPADEEYDQWNLELALDRADKNIGSGAYLEAKILLDSLVRVNPENPGFTERLKTVKIALGEYKGTLIVRTNPWSNVTIDGLYAGATPLKKELVTGEHEIRLESGTEGSTLIVEKIDIEENKIIRLDRDFSKNTSKTGK